MNERLERLIAKAKEKGGELTIEKEPIDEEHLQDIWYSGPIATFMYKGYALHLDTRGIVDAVLVDKDGNELVRVKDENDAGKFYEEMKQYIKNDADYLDKYNYGFLDFQYNNWFEVNCDELDGDYICCFNYYDAIEELIDGNDFLEQIDKTINE